MPALVHHFGKLFADDTKLLAVIKNWNDIKVLQNDIDLLVDRSKKWHMLFHEKKCKVMHFEKRKPNLLNTGINVDPDQICEADPHDEHPKFTMLDTLGTRHTLVEYPKAVS